MLNHLFASGTGNSERVLKYRSDFPIHLIKKSNGMLASHPARVAMSTLLFSVNNSGDMRYRSLSDSACQRSLTSLIKHSTMNNPILIGIFCPPRSYGNTADILIKSTQWAIIASLHVGFWYIQKINRIEIAVDRTLLSARLKNGFATPRCGPE